MRDVAHHVFRLLSKQPNLQITPVSDQYKSRFLLPSTHPNLIRACCSARG